MNALSACRQRMPGRAEAECEERAERDQTATASAQLLRRVTLLQPKLLLLLGLEPNAAAFDNDLKVDVRRAVLLAELRLHGADLLGELLG